ncbi:uncharacterized protein [Apostichopus japonicus]|uniref:uncharacterized protein isoform X2 n=1 Tax=Stichopus japonicus TaxID=307972 RepID=UPI003AB7EB9E
MADLPDDFVKEQLKREVKIIGTSQIENYTVYTIQVSVSDCHWTVKHRYSEFCALHDKLVGANRVEKSALPPKKLFGNTSKAFIEKRRSDLEEYLQKVLDENLDLPRPVLIFLEFDIYDLFGVAQALAAELYEKGDVILSGSDMCEMTPMQLYAITERLKLPLPTCGSNDARNDIGHIMDFLATLKYLRIAGSTHNLGTSNRKVVQLPFDLSSFKAIEKLQIDLCDMKIVSGLGEMKTTLRSLSVHKSASSIKEILLSHFDNLNELEGESLKTVIQMVAPWSEITKADFRYNNLQKVDASMCLLPRLEHLTLSHNSLTDINNLATLSSLNCLNLSHNAFESLANMHIKLGNIKTLNLSYNHLQNLNGLAKLYSLVFLDVGHNSIERVEDVQAVGNLPCLEELVLFDNPITGIVDYRTKILKLFGDRVAEVKLDGQPASSQEMDTVAILSAIQKSKLQQDKGKQKGHEVSIAEHPSLGQSNNVASNVPENSSTEEGSDFQAQIEKIRQEGGKNWLNRLNELQASVRKPDKEETRRPPEGRRVYPPKTETKMEVGRSSLGDIKSSATATESSEPIMQETQISARALAHCLFDELARHKAHGIHVVADLFNNLSVFFKGPVLCTYGTRHRLTNQPHPDVKGSTIVEILTSMEMPQQKEFLGILKGLADGSAKLYNPIHPSQHEAIQVYEYVKNFLGKETVRDIQKEVVEVLPDRKSDQKKEVAIAPREEEAFPSEVHQQKAESDKSVQTLPTPQTNPLPDYSTGELEYISSCNSSKIVTIPGAMGFIKTMKPLDLVKFFHDNVAQISLEPERLLHMLWTTVITFADPKKPVVALVLLSSKALYFVSQESLKFFSESINGKSHRRIRSDFGVSGNTLTFKSGQVDRAHQSGVLHTTDTSGLDCVQCQHKIDFGDITEVCVGLFSQKLRITGSTPDTTVTLLTQNFQLTKDFQEKLMQALPDGEVREPQSPEPDGGDIYNQAHPPFENHTGVSEYVHPSNVTFYYQYEETIEDLRHVLSESLTDSTPDLTQSSLLFYRICHQTYVGELTRGAETFMKEQSQEEELCSLFILNQHIALCNENHVSYPLPTFIRALPDSVHYHPLDNHPIRNLKRIVLSDFTSKDITLIFEVLDVDVDISKDHFSSSDGEATKHDTPDVAWTVLLASQEDRERVVKMLSTQWKEIHNRQLSIQVSA